VPPPVPRFRPIPSSRPLRYDRPDVNPASPFRRALLELLLLGLLAWLAAIGVSGVTRLALDDRAPLVGDDREPAAASATPEPLEAFQTIATRDVFNGGAAPRSGPPPALRLWGVGMHGEQAYAVIENSATGEQALHRVGDEIGDARITAISWDRVTLRRPDGEHTLVLTTEPAAGADTPGGERPVVVPPSQPDRQVRQTGPDSFIVDRRALTGAVDNTSGLLTQLRAVPEVTDGRPVGFRLFQINPESVFARLGIRNGDVVQRVNGTTLADPASLLGFLERLRDEPRVALDIMRAGRPRTLVYDLR
jgi:type II secretion system protein C